jgi:hypothetical protein
MENSLGIALVAVPTESPSHVAPRYSHQSHPAPTSLRLGGTMFDPADLLFACNVISLSD